MKNTKLETLLILIFITGICIQINAEIIPICTEIHKQYLPVSAKSMLNDIVDGAVIGWCDERNSGSLYVQKLNGNGNIEWTKKGIMIDSHLGGGFTSDADYPQIFSDNLGGAVIIYRKAFFSSEEIYFQRVYRDGSHLGRPVCLSSYYSGFNYSPVAALANNNSIVVAWENFSGGDFNIHSQKINFEGDKLWNDGNEVQVCDFLFDQRKPSLFMDMSGYAVFTWLDERNSMNNNEFEFDLYGNRLDGDGNYTNYNSKGKLIFSNNNILNTGSEANPKNGNCYFDGNNPINNILKMNFFNHNATKSDKNSFIVAFEKRIGFDDSFIKVIKVNENLNIEWSNDIEADSYQTNPLIVSDSDYGACIFWNDERNNENAVYGIRFDANGKHLWGNETGIQVSFDEMKNSARRIIPSDKNQNGIFSEYGNIYLSWVTIGANKLFLSKINIINESGKCSGAIEINENINEGEYTSVTTMENNVIVVYMQSDDIFASIIQFSENDNAAEINRKINMSNFPNPFNPVTTINFELKEDGFVNLRVYDIIGREIRTLVNEYKSEGKYSIEFDAQGLSGGVYFYRLESNGIIMTKRMTLIK